MVNEGSALPVSAGGDRLDCGAPQIGPFRATRLWFSVVVDVTCVAVPE